MKDAERSASSRMIMGLRLPAFLSDLIGYGLCSAAALALDCGLLYGLTQAGMNYLPAAAIGFLSGMLLAYGASVRFVYRTRRTLDWKREALGFFAIGFAGLLLNQGALYAFVGGLHLALPLAKALAAVGVFLFNFLGRRSVLFSTPERA